MELKICLKIDPVLFKKQHTYLVNLAINWKAILKPEEAELLDGILGIMDSISDELYEESEAHVRSILARMRTDLQVAQKHPDNWPEEYDFIMNFLYANVADIAEIKEGVE